MSRGPETTFIASVHRHLPKSLYWMKNHNQFNSGIADCWYDGPNGDLWVEYKFITIPKKPDTMIEIGLSERQLLWLGDRYDNGRNVAVIVGCKEGGVWFSTKWEEPMSAATFRFRLMTRMVLAKNIVRLCHG